MSEPVCKFNTRCLTDKLFKKFLNNGEYCNILRAVNDDNDLIMCLRGKGAFIYYKSMLLLRIWQSGLMEIAERHARKFLESSLKFDFCCKSEEEKKGHVYYAKVCPKVDNYEDWCFYFEKMKEIIDAYQLDIKANKEKEVQQGLVRENNFGAIGTDFFILDIEYTQSHFKGRFDALGITLSDDKKTARLAIIEVKEGYAAIKDDDDDDATRYGSGLKGHYVSVCDFFGKTDKYEFQEERFWSDLKSIASQMSTLGLWNIPAEIAENLEFDRKNIQFLFVLFNYPKKSVQLKRALDKIKGQMTENKRDGKQVRPFEIGFVFRNEADGFSLNKKDIRPFEFVCEKVEKNEDLY